VDKAGNIEAATTVHFSCTRISGTGTLRIVWGNCDTVYYEPVSGSYAYWTVRSGGASGQVIATGSAFGGTGWDGVDDVVVAARAEPYHVSIEWWDEEWDAEDVTVHYPVYVGSGDTVILRY
jgi:hypothetical protein